MYDPDDNERPGDWSVEEAEREQERPSRPGFAEVASIARAHGYSATSAGYVHVGPNLMGEAVCRNPLTGSAIHVQEATPEEAINVLLHLLTRRRSADALDVEAVKMLADAAEAYRLARPSALGSEAKAMNLDIAIGRVRRILAERNTLPKEEG